VSRTGSLLYISQSAVSKRIAFFEKKLAEKLVLPDGRRIRLTCDAKEIVANLGDTIIHLDCSVTALNAAPKKVHMIASLPNLNSG
jgi:DNA-binding transcriptional LysR family regulator